MPTAGFALLVLTACGVIPKERAAGGALRGAVTGTIVGGAAGGAVGAAVGAATDTAVGEVLDETDRKANDGES
jgi:hypothetical protein